MSEPNLELKKFHPGEVLFEENEESFYFYMIKEGRVEVYRNSGDGQKVVLAVLEDGNSLGEFAMIDRKPRSASARALTDVTAVKISEQGYASLLAELPTWSRAMLEGLVQRLRKANEIIERHESIDEQTRTDFKASEFDTQASIKLNFDFSNVTLAED